MQAKRGWKQPTALSNHESYKPQQQPTWHNKRTCTVVAHIPDLHGHQLVSNWTEDLLNKGNHIWQWKPKELLSANEVMHIGGGPIATTKLA